MLKSVFLYLLLIVFVIISWSRLCDSRFLEHKEKKLNVNLEHSTTKNNNGFKELEAPSTNKRIPLSSQAQAEANHGDINGEINDKKTKKDRVVKRARVDKRVSSSSTRVSRTWKVPKYSKKRTKQDQEHPGFNLDYMQPTTHPPHHN